MSYQRLRLRPQASTDHRSATVDKFFESGSVVTYADEKPRLRQSRLIPLPAAALGARENVKRFWVVGKTLAGFSVDTKLFRELGELLVGRESTALIELIKNAYDADATKVTILGEQLRAGADGQIIVTDNGIGMTEEEFSRGFLRIAGRSKTSGERRSPWYERRYTGEKGVGRLAAHKLAHRVGVRTRKWNGDAREEELGFPSIGELRARIDWDAIEELESLDEIEGSDAVRVRLIPVTRGYSGTSLRLKPLRKAWSEKDLKGFYDEVATLTPPDALVRPIASLVGLENPLLNQISLRDDPRGSNFEIVYAGDLQLDESEIPAEANSASWVIELNCDINNRILSISVQPTQRTLSEYSNAEGFRIDRPLEDDEPSIGFQARILQREYESWPTRYRGIRVYYEGFRVLPYGDAKDDWLELDRDYRSRGRSELGRLKTRSDWNLPNGREQEGLSVQGNSAFFGAILLTRSGADQLRMLVNREGFLPSDQFDFISEMVRLAIDLQVRLRYATTADVKQARRVSSTRQRNAASRSSNGQAPSAFLLQELQSSAIEELQSARTEIMNGRSASAALAIDNVRASLTATADLAAEVSSEATMFRVVASLGLEHAAFVHEVRSLSLSAQAIADTLDSLAAQATSRRMASALRSAAQSAKEMRERLKRNAVYLADVTGVEGRRRRSRQRLIDRVNHVLNFYTSTISRRGVTVNLDINETVQTPPMFPAEVTAIISNLVSNAVKFAGQSGIIGISARTSPETLTFRIENTGSSVDLQTADRWFDPFRSTTTNVDEALGQGMGLGLTITRSLLDEYGATIKFKRPSGSYATAVEVEIPTR